MTRSKYYDTGPAKDHTLNSYDGGFAMADATSGFRGSVTHLISPIFIPIGQGGGCLTFYLFTDNQEKKIPTTLTLMARKALDDDYKTLWKTKRITMKWEKRQIRISPDTIQVRFNTYYFNGITPFHFRLPCCKLAIQLSSVFTIVFIFVRKMNRNKGVIFFGLFQIL